jgi:hypothetical protein
MKNLVWLQRSRTVHRRSLAQQVSKIFKQFRAVAPALLHTRMQIVENGRSERIRTSDPLLPKQVRYQAALHSELDFSARKREAADL